jgi:hypothetical protein
LGFGLTVRAILFLDFDGVLHSDAAFLVKGRPTFKTGGELFMWAPPTERTRLGFEAFGVGLRGITDQDGRVIRVGEKD